MRIAFLAIGKGHACDLVARFAVRGFDVARQGHIIE